MRRNGYDVDQFLAFVNLTNTRVVICYNKFSGIAKHVRWFVKLKQNALDVTCTSDASAL
jgi:hypothetical protein